MHYIYNMYSRYSAVYRYSAVGIVQYYVDTIQILGLQIRIIIFPVNGFKFTIII